MARFISTDRGNPVWVENDPTGELEFEDRTFHYIVDDGICDDDHRRPCRRCGKMPLDGGEDACIGHVPGLVGACCGHGVEDSYFATEGGFAINVSGLYSNHDSLRAWEQEEPEFSDDPGDHPIVNGWIRLYQTDDGQYLWTPVAPVASMTYRAEIPRDVPIEETDVSIIIGEINRLYPTYTSSGDVFRLPTIPEAMAIVEVLAEFVGAETINPFYTSNRWAGFIPLLVENYEGFMDIVKRYPFHLNDLRIVATIDESMVPPETITLDIPESYRRERNTNAVYY